MGKKHSTLLLEYLNKKGIHISDDDAKHAIAYIYEFKVVGKEIIPMESRYKNPYIKYEDL